MHFSFLTCQLVYVFNLWMKFFLFYWYDWIYKIIILNKSKIRFWYTISENKTYALIIGYIPPMPLKNYFVCLYDKMFTLSWTWCYFIVHKFLLGGSSVNCIFLNADLYLIYVYTNLYTVLAIIQAGWRFGNIFILKEFINKRRKICLWRDPN